MRKGRPETKECYFLHNNIHKVTKLVFYRRKPLKNRVFIEEKSQKLCESAIKAAKKL